MQVFHPTLGMKCYCCGKSGHMKKFCPSKSLRCGGCGKVGHTVRTCWKMAHTTCFCCGEKGHTKSFCAKRGAKCGSCGMLGHTKETCRQIKTEVEGVKREVMEIKTELMTDCGQRVTEVKDTGEPVKKNTKAKDQGRVNVESLILQCVSGMMEVMLGMSSQMFELDKKNLHKLIIQSMDTVFEKWRTSEKRQGCM